MCKFPDHRYWLLDRTNFSLLGPAVTWPPTLKVDELRWPRPQLYYLDLENAFLGDRGESGRSFVPRLCAEGEETSIPVGVRDPRWISRFYREVWGLACRVQQRDISRRAYETRFSLWTIATPGSATPSPHGGLIKLLGTTAEGGLLWFIKIIRFNGTE